MTDKEQKENIVKEDDKSSIPTVYNGKELEAFQEEHPGMIINVVLDLGGGKDG